MVYRENIKLKGYWSFEETAGDLIDVFNGTNNGTIIGAPTREVDGAVKKAYFFDGDDENFFTLSDHTAMECTILI